ncbi:MAG: hypothetical protein P1R58_01740 [bacterium]|nr:hypothetical protein [bacterium]
MKRLIIIIAILVITPTIWATPPTIVHPLYVDMESISFDKATRTAIVEVSFTLANETRYQICKDFQMGETIIREASLTSPIDWKVSFGDETRLSRELGFTIGQHDTALIQLTILRMDHEKFTSIRRYFVAGDTLEIWQSNPRDVAKKKDSSK